MKAVSMVALAAALVAGGDLHAHGDAKVTALLQQPLADHPGKEGLMALVEMAPGHVDPVHRHPGHVFVYVLEGAVEMQVEGGERKVLNAGDTFYENPKDTHPVGRNLSNTGPAKLLVFFVKEQGAQPVLPVEKH